MKHIKLFEDYKNEISISNSFTLDSSYPPNIVPSDKNWANKLPKLDNGYMRLAHMTPITNIESILSNGLKCLRMKNCGHLDDYFRLFGETIHTHRKGEKMAYILVDLKKDDFNSMYRCHPKRLGVKNGIIPTSKIVGYISIIDGSPLIFHYNTNYNSQAEMDFEDDTDRYNKAADDGPFFKGKKEPDMEPIEIDGDEWI